MVLEAGTGSVNVVDGKPQQLSLLKSAAKRKKMLIIYYRRASVVDPHGSAFIWLSEPVLESGSGSGSRSMGKKL
jgi:hypothetical protein